MLNICFKGFGEKCIKNPSVYFDNMKEKDWFNDVYVKKIIKDIDGVTAVKDEYMEDPIFGTMSPERLSSGCKALILLYVLNNVNIYASRMGDNCAKYIIDISKNKDITITLHHAMLFPYDFDAVVIDNGHRIHSREDYIKEYTLWKYGK